VTPAERFMITQLRGPKTPIWSADPVFRQALRMLGEQGLARVEEGVGMASGLTFAEPTEALLALYQPADRNGPLGQTEEEKNG
jgi:hypothetical protein